MNSAQSLVRCSRFSGGRRRAGPTEFASRLDSAHTSIVVLCIVMYVHVRHSTRGRAAIGIARSTEQSANQRAAAQQQVNCPAALVMHSTRQSSDPIRLSVSCRVESCRRSLLSSPLRSAPLLFPINRTTRRLLCSTVRADGAVRCGCGQLLPRRAIGDMRHVGGGGRPD